MTDLEDRIARIEIALGLVSAPGEVDWSMVKVRIIAISVCVAFDVSLDDLLNGGARGRLQPARAATCWLARNYTGRSLPQIASALQRRDHTTIIARIKWAERARAEDPAYRARLDAVRDRLVTAGVIDQ